jgi:hypothetical protein
MSDKKLQTEGLFGAAKKFSDAFFDGLKNNATKAMLDRAEQEGVPLPIIQKMKNLKKEKEELDKLLSDISKQAKAAKK